MSGKHEAAHIEEHGHYEDIQRAAATRGWWRRPPLDDAVYLSMEHEATQVRDLNTTHLPVLLQTTDYLRAALKASPSAPSPEQIDAALTAQQYRRHRVDQHHVQFHFLICQPALQQPLSHDQLTHLIQRSKQDNIKIQVLSPRHLPATQKSLTLLSFPDQGEPDVAYTMDHIGAHPTPTRQPVASLHQTFDLLSTLAMSPNDSHHYLKNRLDDLVAKPGNRDT